MIAYWISEVAQNHVAPAGQWPAYPSGVCLGELLGSASDQQHQEAGEDASCCFQMCTAYVAMLPFHLASPKGPSSKTLFSGLCPNSVCCQTNKTYRIPKS